MAETKSIYTGVSPTSPTRKVPPVRTAPYGAIGLSWGTLAVAVLCIPTAMDAFAPSASLPDSTGSVTASATNELVLGPAELAVFAPQEMAPEAVPAPLEPALAFDAGLALLIEKWVEEQDADYAVYVAELEGGLRTASYQAATPWVPASVYKLFVAYGILAAVDSGGLELSDLTNDGQAIGSCLEAMIVASDNNCTYSLHSTLGIAAFDEVLSTRGFAGTVLNDYADGGFGVLRDDVRKTTTVRDVAFLLNRLYDGELLKKQTSEYLLSLMLDQIHRERVPAGVPGSVDVADKPGWLQGEDGIFVQNDAAIVYADEPYTVVIASTETEPDDVAVLSELIFEYLGD